MAKKQKVSTTISEQPKEAVQKQDKEKPKEQEQEQVESGYWGRYGM